MKLSSAVLAAITTCLPSIAAAGGFGIPEIGARRTGMAAVVGRPDEPSAIFHNPAGLTLQPGLRVYATFGLALIDTEFQLRPWRHSTELIDTPVGADGYYPATTPSRAIGAIPMLTVSAEILPKKLWAAVGAYVSNGTGAAFREDDVTRYHLIDGYIISPTVTGVLAYQVTPKLAIGVGAGVMNVRIHGSRQFFPFLTVDRNGDGIPDDSDMDGVPDERDLRALIGTNAELTVDGEDWATTWNAGVLARPIPRLTLGATVIGRVDPELVGPIKVTYGDDAGVPGDVTQGIAITKLILPWTFLAGANYDVHPQVELGTEARYYLYRAYKEQLTLVNGVTFTDRLVTPKNYTDSWQLAGGVRVHDLRQAPALELMLGGHYDKTPAPKETVTFDQPTFSHIGLHTGARYQLGRYRLAATYVHYWYVIPTTTASLTAPPSNFRGEGGNNIVTVSIEAQLGGAVLP